MKFDKKDVIRALAVIAAALISAVNVNAFVNAGGLFPGGFSGVTILIQRLVKKLSGTEIPFTPLHLALNVFPAYLGYKYIGKKFTIFSCLYTILYSVLVDVIKVPAITDDVLLICLFGGILSGVAGAICLHAGTSGGGTDFISKYLTVVKGMDGWSIIFASNCAILVLAGILFGWDKALYSIVYQFAATETVKKLYRKYKQDTLFIVTNKPKEVSEKISEIANHGATIIKAEGSYNGADRYMVYSVVSSGESSKVLKAVRDTDPEAFLNRMHTQQVLGNFYIEKDE